MKDILKDFVEMTELAVEKCGCSVAETVPYFTLATVVINGQKYGVTVEINSIKKLK